MEDATVDPGLVDVFIGANGSGKSHLAGSPGSFGLRATTARTERIPVEDMTPNAVPHD